MLTNILTIGRVLIASVNMLNGSTVLPVANLVHPTLQNSSAIVRTDPNNPSDYPMVSPLAGVNVSGSSADLTPEEQSLFDETNRDRESQGLPDLSLDPLLCIVARGHSQDMCQRQYFDHIAPQPGPASPMDRYLAALGYRPNYALVGENIYYRSQTDETESTAIEAETAFMHSPSHRQNILRSGFTRMGVGYYRDPSTGAFWVTVMFLKDTAQ